MMDNLSNITVIAVPNKLNIAITSDFRSQLYNGLKAGDKNFIIDFSKCEFIDSAGLGVLVSVYKKAMEQGGSVKLANLNSIKVLKIFQLTRLEKVFEIYPSVEEAKLAF